MKVNKFYSIFLNGIDFFPVMVYNVNGIKIMLNYIANGVFMIINEFINGISYGAFDEQMRRLYGSSEKALLRQKARYLSATENFSRLYPECGEIKVFSAPGGTEISGNRTDRQCGCIIAAAVDSDIIAIVSFHDEGVIRIQSDGSSADEVSLNDLSVHDEEKGTLATIIRGIAAKFIQSGINIGGFDAYTASDIISSGNFSSLSAFEVLIGTIIDRHYNNGRLGAVEIAKIGQYAERIYFGKAGSLMEQAVSSVGGFVYIDFKNATEPHITPIKCDFESSGYCICITDTRKSNSGLSEEYRQPLKNCSVKQKLDRCGSCKESPPRSAELSVSPSVRFTDTSSIGEEHSLQEGLKQQMPYITDFCQRKFVKVTYSLISDEMNHIAKELGVESPRDISEEDFYEKLPELREKFSDREILTAANFFYENKMMESEKEALEYGDTQDFFDLVNKLGNSFAQFFQNLFSGQNPEIQSILLAIMLSKRVLNGCGAVRIHGDFDGTIQAFVPNYLAEAYVAEMNRIFGEYSCTRINVRSIGGTELII